MKRRKMMLQKNALMIAPSYSALDKENRLTANEIDVQAMKNALTTKFDFQDEHIKVLQEDQANKDNILVEIEKLAKSCEPRSVVFLYYSGHGVYLPDSQDEGLVPTLLKWPIDKPAEEVCITGQDLLPFFEALSKKSVYCTVIFDCCHSGHLYREFKELEGLKIKQFVLEPTTSEHKRYTKANRGGWLPKKKDYFFYFAACSSVQKALELREKGGLLTLAILDVLDKLQSPDQVTYEAFFRLLMKEFKILKKTLLDKVDQIPQFEAVNSNTVLLGNVSVQQIDGGIEICDIDNDKAVLNSGFLQNLRAGQYFVYETTASADSINLKNKSPDYLGTIEVNEGNIDIVQAFGSYSLHDNARKITPGCLAYLEVPMTINHCVYVCPDDARTLLIKELNDTHMLNIFTEYDEQIESNPDMITITRETIESKSCWVARQMRKIFVPPISVGVGNESTMAANLCRYIRYHEVLNRAKSPTDDEDLLKDVTLKVVKAENLQYVQHKKNEVLEEKLKEGIDITEVNDQIFRPHEVDVFNKLKRGTGDSLIWQVKNGKEDREDIVHICVILFQCDGEIEVLYPKKKCCTVELAGGGTFEAGVVSPFINQSGLRRMAEPDPTKNEPETIMDTLVLYASSKPLDYGPLLQSAIQTDPELLSKAPRADSKPLSNLETFLKCLKTTSPANDRDLKDAEDTIDMKYMIKKVPIYTYTKNR